MTGHFDTTHIWRSNDFDFPCTPTGEEWSEAEKIFVRVQTPDGNTSVVPKDELVERDDTGFLSCDLDRCRPGIGRALRASLRELRSGKTTICLVMAPRYGKSHFMRQLSVELIERDVASVCIALGPWTFLRDQLNDKNKIEDMVKHHAIRRPKVIVHDVLSGSLDPEFYKVTPRRHWWSLTMAQAYTPKTRSILCDLAAQFKHEKRPLVVFIDESHLTSIGDYGWGKLAAELKAAGAILILLTGTPERADNVAPYGFRTEEVDRADFQYKVFKKIDDEQTKMEFFEAEKVRYRVIPDVPMVGLQQAWNEKALTKLQHRFFGFKTDGELVIEIANHKARRALGAALRDSETIRFAVREMLDELRLRRQTDGGHGASAPTTAAIVFVGNDRADDDVNDWHAREVRRIIIQEWSNFLPGKPKVQITTRHTTDDDSEKAAEAIKSFVDGDGDIIIVKQMGGVGLDAPRIKVGLDLSTIRTKSNTTQRWLRLATLWEDVTHGTMILPNDPITMQLWHDIVEEQGGQYSIENATLIDSKIIRTEPKAPDPKPVISDQQRAGSIDQSLRLVEADLDQKLDAIFAKSPIFAIRFTRRELADEYEKGLFRDIVLDDITAEPPPPVTIFDATAEVDKKIGRINDHCKQLANREASYEKDGDRAENEIWVNHFRRWMSEAKNYAGIRGELKTCRDINKLTNAEAWLEAQLDNQ
jgi:superfamily II DNA or RNA helicase